MKRIKRILAAVLAFVLVILQVPVHSQAAEQDMYSLIEAQIRAYADSIDQKNADEAAAMALATHAMTGGGKKFSVGADHALTATLFNSELLQAALTDGCTEAIRSMQQLGLSSLPYIGGSCRWYASSLYFHLYTRVSERFIYESRDWKLTLANPYTGKTNGYDDSLEWIAGVTDVMAEIARIKVTEDTATYKVVWKVVDRFDFETSGNGAFKDLISGIGAIVFREFDWEAAASFELTVPYYCTHTSGNYHWTYDAENQMINQDSSWDYRKNGVTRHTVEKNNGTYYYYELDESVRLYHDRPWVIEYEVKKAGTFVFSPLEDYFSTTYPSVIHSGGTYLYMFHTDHITVSKELMEEYGLQGASQLALNYYGTKTGDYFRYSPRKNYRYRLENEINDDGSNMIYLTVEDVTDGEILIDRVPLDDYYRLETWIGAIIYQNDENDWVSGKDLFIHYIGNLQYPFSADYFDLRIWENGVDGGNGDYFVATEVEATCTTGGYTAHTCEACGYSYQDNFVDALGHDLGEWVITEAPTCTEGGWERRDCSRCEDFEVREVAAIGHIFGDWIVIREATMWATGEQVRYCEGCGLEERVKTPKLDPPAGDATCDGLVNVRDVILLRQFLAGWDVEIHNAGDANGDGKINVKDVILLRQYLAGWDVQLGVS